MTDAERLAELRRAFSAWLDALAAALQRDQCSGNTQADYALVWGP